MNYSHNCQTVEKNEENPEYHKKCCNNDNQIESDKINHLQKNSIIDIEKDEIPSSLNASFHENNIVDNVTQTNKYLLSDFNSSDSVLNNHSNINSHDNNTNKNEEIVPLKNYSQIITNNHEMHDDILDLEHQAEILKKEGNDFFKRNQFFQAIECYTKAIECLKDHTNLSQTSIHIYYTNRAFCNIKLEKFGGAILDAEMALKFNPTYTKAFYRRACANFCLLNYSKASKDFGRILKSTNDADVLFKFNECQKLLRQEKFAKAISSDCKPLVSESINIDNFIINDGYAGPNYSKVAMTSDFVIQLINFIKEPGNILHKKYVYMILLDVLTILKELKNVERVNVPVDQDITICGDIHGQFYDLLNIFEINGYPSENQQYLFNGDFIDRGSFSVESIIVLLTFKLLYPKHFHLTRGNHESQNMNKLYGFQGELLSKYNSDETLYDLFSECFNALPIAHLINEKVFVVHGGLFSRDNVTLEDIDKIHRFCEPPDSGLMTEMLWSDPQEQLGRSPSKRGIACQFGPDVTENFLMTNNLSLVIRSHEMKEEGYSIEHGGKLITVFSAPNYCDQAGNDGAFIRLNGKDLEPRFTVFSAVDHPVSTALKYANPFIRLM